MPSLIDALTQQFATAFATHSYDPALGAVVISQRPELGQFQCNGALPAAKQYKQNPRTIAQQVIDSLPNPAIFAELSLAGPGFINITLKDDYLAQQAQAQIEDDRFGQARVNPPRTVIIDFCSPNVAKPMHAGHIRTTVIGDCLQRLYRFMGDNVLSDSHLGDWGVQMGMIIYGVRQRKPDLPYFQDDDTGPYPTEAPVTMAELDVLYPAVSAQSETDPTVREAVRQTTVQLQQGHPGYRALWQSIVDLSNAHQAKDLAVLDVTFDYIYGESHYHDLIPTMLAHLKEEGLSEESRGATVVPLTPPEGEQEIPPLILVKSDGGYMYGTTDLATVIERVNKFKADLVLYVIDARQSLHMKQVILAAEQTNVAPNTALVHVAFGTINGPDGKPFKTRAGGVMPLRDLIQMSIDKANERMVESGVATDYDEAERQSIAKKIGVATLKYAELMNDRTTNYILDLDRLSKFEGRTGPYLLYTAVRIKSILRRAEEQGLQAGSLLPPANEAERNLMLVMARWPDAAHLAYAEYAPKYLCDFAFDLAQQFNQFYSQCHIINEADKARQGAWLGLSEACLRQLTLVLSLLGIEIPERM